MQHDADAVQVLYDISIGDPDNFVTRSAKERAAPCIIGHGLVSKMGIAVDFDDETRMVAAEIEDVGVEGNLAAEMEAEWTKGTEE